MGLHLVAFDASDAANAALTQLNALVSEAETISNNGFIIGDEPLIIGASAYSAHLSRAQFRAPSLQSPDYPLITPVMVARPTSAIDAQWTDLRDGPLTVKVGEALLAYEQHSTSTERVYILALLADKVPAPVTVPFRTIRATGTTTVTADAWSNCLMTIDDQLPFGNYDVIGARYEGATAIAGRLAFPGLASRPGMPGLVDANSSDVGTDYPFRAGNMGVWFSFKSTAQLTLEALCTAADTAQVLYLDIVGPK
jgi:hypothetical protein